MNRRLTTSVRRTLRKGFTLLEILIAVAIVGMLVGIHRRSQVGVTKEFPLSRQTRLAVRL